MTTADQARQMLGIPDNWRDFGDSSIARWQHLIEPLIWSDGRSGSDPSLSVLEGEMRNERHRRARDVAGHREQLLRDHLAELERERNTAGRIVAAVLRDGDELLDGELADCLSHILWEQGFMATAIDNADSAEEMRNVTVADAIYAFQGNCWDDQHEGGDHKFDLLLCRKVMVALAMAGVDDLAGLQALRDGAL